MGCRGSRSEVVVKGHGLQFRRETGEDDLKFGMVETELVRGFERRVSPREERRGSGARRVRRPRVDLDLRRLVAQTRDPSTSLHRRNDVGPSGDPTS